MGVVIFVGSVLLGGTVRSRQLLHQLESTLAGPTRAMELQTYGYRTMRSIYNNRVLATLDDAGSTNRTPTVEFKAIWFTPGIAEAPGGEATVYGGGAPGRAVMAITRAGGVMGRVKRVNRP